MNPVRNFGQDSRKDISNGVKKVYFIRAKEDEGASAIRKKVDRILAESGSLDFIKKNELTAVKMTFGEDGNKYFLGPEYVKGITEKIRHLGARPFLTDANVLYKGKRTNAVDHLEVARKHGFFKCGVPVIIADGLLSKNYKRIEIGQKHFKTVNIARDIVDADCLVVVSHFTGHMQTGFGAAVKNIGMGSASRSGKQQQHSHVKPAVKRGQCTLCKACFEICPVSAIAEKDGEAFIAEEVCVGCAECMAACKFFAIKITWQEADEILQEKMAEYALGALRSKKDRAAFINFALRIPEECDCWAQKNAIIAKDVGIFASSDPIALDKATVDKVLEKEGCDVFKKAHSSTDWHRQLEYSARIGLGSLEYELVEIKE